jgi:Secretion system C-terminal sorting domain
MKKILLTFLLLTSISFSARLFAQYPCNGGANNCDLGISNTVVQIVSTNAINGNTQCEVVFNVAFDLSYNSGNKDIFIHSWLAADYPNYFPCSPGSEASPSTTILGAAADQVTKSFLDIGLDNSVARGGVGVPVNVPIYTTYVDYPTVVLTSPSNSPGMTCTKTYVSGTIDRVTINNVKVILNAVCGATINVKTDVWSRNGTNGPAQCWVAGQEQFFNDPQITGFKNCNSPRQYSVNISTIDPALKTIKYKVYLDVNGNGSLEIGTDIPAYTSPDIQISAVGGTGPDSYSSGLLSLPAPYSNTQPYAEYNYLILVEGATLSNNVLKSLADPACIPLPVDMKSFTAARTQSNVLLKWETSTEQNSKGFAVERNIKGTWEQIGFVLSQAPGGNSSAVLAYQFVDFNNAKGVSQYRIKQVDLDNKAKFSEIRSVRGDGQLGKTIVYPNPTADGKVNIVFEDKNVTRDIAVSDMSGRIIKQMKSVTNNNIIIDNLTPGMYSIRIVAVETGEQIVEKVIVNKR